MARADCYTGIKRHRGFTLIELMVVMLIMGVMSGLVLLSPRIARNNPALSEAQRLQTLFELARDKALMTHQTYGFQLVNERWHYWHKDLQQWQPWDEDVFSAYELPESVQIRGEEPSDLHAIQARVSSDWVVIYPDYQMTPFHLLISDCRQSATRHASLTSDGLSDVSIQ